MPVMDGLETLPRLLRNKRDIPVILHTAYSQYREDFMTWAADAYVVKSPDARELKDNVKAFLSMGHEEAK